MIIVFGSINVDFIMQLDRLPERGETVLGGEYVVVQGGKGANQACAAARATSSATVAMVGGVGSDEWADFSLERLRGSGVDLSCVARTKRQTGCAFICVDSAGENSIAVASGANLDVVASSVPDEWLVDGSWVVLQMETPHEENWALVRRANAGGARIVLNLAPAAIVPEDILRRIDVLLVNEIEARTIANLFDLTSDNLTELVKSLAKQFDLLSIISLGAQGVVASNGSETWAVDALPITVADTTGAGDAFTGCLVAALESGSSVPDALQFASVGAGLSCATVGAQTSFATHDQIRMNLPRVRAVHE
jgi:ribokinase